MRKLIKRHTKIVLASALCLILLASCVQYYKIYGFKRIERNFSWGRVGARLHTTTEDHLFWVNFKSPYRLGIWFESDSLIQGTVQIVQLKLTLKPKKLYSKRFRSMRNLSRKTCRYMMPLFHLKTLS